MTLSNLHKFMDYPVEGEIHLVEEFDREKLKTIIENFDDLYDKIGKFTDCTNGYKKIEDKGKTLTILQTLYRKKKVTYKPSANSKDGRLFGSGSLQGINKIVRHTLAKGIYIDYDIKNAHNMLLQYYCEWNNIPCKNLIYYNQNREELIPIFAEWYKIDNGEAKKIVLSIINGGNEFVDRSDAYEFLYDLKTEIHYIHTKICELEHEKYKKNKKKYNAMGSTVNSLLCKMENIILQCILKYCRRNKITVGTLCFDGLLVKDKVEVEKLEEFIFSELGMKLEIIEKDMDKGLDLTSYEKCDVNSVKSDNTDKNKTYDFFDTTLIQEENCGVFVLNKLIKNKVIYYHKKHNELYFFNEENFLYEEQDFEFLMTYISSTCKEYFQSLGLYDKTKEYSPSVAKAISLVKNGIYKTCFQRSVLTQVKIRLPDDSEFIDNNFDRIEYLFPIADNKVIDFRFDTIRDRTRDDYFTKTTNLIYDQDVDVEIIRNFLKTYLVKEGKEIDLDDELHIDNFLYSMGYCITGYNHLKKIFIMIGAKDTGKSTLLNDKIFKLFGQFFNMVDKKVVCDTNTNSVHTQEYFSMIGKRFISCGELTTHDKFNVSLMKTISGNDKTVPLRRCGSDKNYNGIIDCKIVLPLNSMIKTGDDAIMERVIAFNFPNVLLTKL